MAACVGTRAGWKLHRRRAGLRLRRAHQLTGPAFSLGRTRPRLAVRRAVEGRARLSVVVAALPGLALRDLEAPTRQYEPGPQQAANLTRASPAPHPRQDQHSMPRHARNLRYERDHPSVGRYGGASAFGDLGMSIYAVAVAERLVHLVAMVAAGNLDSDGPSAGRQIGEAGQTRHESRRGKSRQAAGQEARGQPGYQHPDGSGSVRVKKPGGTGPSHTHCACGRWVTRL